ncbi:hypothetical protein JR316_0002934 [Psilocybe cubensis]|uniref:Uncharacterized protein n=2 Tax=Psilocybe cubensis TaxID=181762 RepID=A0ACB8H6H3_PSICU|nr:hypothetical protein JR316_0002934 [Psilocybe cubensis]KAH9483466.1 hypothetical protein JR316_0002934 [Psilocybe cubensis]
MDTSALNPRAEDPFRKALEKYPENVDILIPVIGRSGVGKSEFINAVLREEYGQGIKSEQLMDVQHTLRRCTVDVRLAELGRTSEGRRVVLVDTPGLIDGLDSRENEGLHVEKVANWFKEVYRTQDSAVLGGIIYLHNLAHDTLHHEDRQSLLILKALCGVKSLCRVVVATTRWDTIKDEASITWKLRDLEEFYGSIIKEGATFVKENRTAREIVAMAVAKYTPGAPLQIQQEMNEKHSSFSKTTVGSFYREPANLKSGFNAIHTLTRRMLASLFG